MEAWRFSGGCEGPNSRSARLVNGKMYRALRSCVARTGLMRLRYAAQIVGAALILAFIASLIMQLCLHMQPWDSPARRKHSH